MKQSFEEFFQEHIKEIESDIAKCTNESSKQVLREYIQRIKRQAEDEGSTSA